MAKDQFTREVLKGVERLDTNVHVLLAGGNLGDPVKNLLKALELFKQRVGGEVIVSHMYKTAAWGFESEDDFVNQAWIVKAKIELDELLGTLQSIERDMGRKARKGASYESRIMDIDIIFSSQQIIDRQNIQVPHPRMHERKFVLEPLNELIPNYIHPAMGRKIRVLNESLDDEIEQLSPDF